MQQPASAWDIVVAIACAECQVRNLQPHIRFPVEGGTLPLTRRGQQEAARRLPLDITLREGGGVGETAVVEDIEGIHVERLHLQHVSRKLDALHAVVVVPAREVFGILIDDVKAETLAVGVEVQFVVAILAHQLGGIK